MKFLVGQKTVTVMQSDGIYKERYTCPSAHDPFPEGSTPQIRFYDYAGSVILVIYGTYETPMAGGWQHLVFKEEPATVGVVPNGAAFKVLITDDDGVQVFKYGTVFRREPFFFTY